MLLRKWGLLHSLCQFAYLEIVDLGINITRGIRSFAAALVAAPHAELPFDV